MSYFNRHLDEIYDQISIDEYDQISIDDHLESLRAKGLKYRVKHTKSGDSLLEIEIYPINPVWKELEGKERAKASLPSREAQKNLNQANKVKSILRLLHANFTTEDIWCTFVYDHEYMPADMKEAVNHLKNYFRRLKRHIKKNELPELKYIYVTERVENEKTGKIHAHHHLVMNFRDRDTAEKLWKLGGRTEAKRLQPDPDGTFTQLANYLAKTETKEGNRRGSKTYVPSKNLARPKTTKSDYRLPKTDYRISKKRVTEMALNENKAIEVLEKHYPGYKVAGDIKPKFSDYTAGAYMYVCMARKDAHRVDRR